MSVGCFISDRNNQIKVYGYSVRPHPIWLPGTVQGEGKGELFTRLDDISVDLTLLKRVGVLWVKVPCVDMAGSWYVAIMMKLHLQQYWHHNHLMSMTCAIPWILPFSSNIHLVEPKHVGSTQRPRTIVYHWINERRKFFTKSIGNWALFQCQIRRLIVRSREVSKPRDWQFQLSHRFEIWQALRQQCCRGACQISERSSNSKHRSRGFANSRDLTIRRLIGYWNGALDWTPLPYARHRGRIAKYLI